MHQKCAPVSFRCGFDFLLGSLSLSWSVLLLRLYLLSTFSSPSHCALYTLHPLLALSLPNSFMLYSLRASALSLCWKWFFFFFFNKKPLTSLTSAPPQVSCGHFGSVNAPSHPKKRKEKRLCPPSLTPTKSISWQVGDKSNSVTLAAGVMLGGWQRTSPSNRCQHCHCCHPTQHEPYREREVVVEGEEEGQIWLGGTGCCRAAMIRKIEASNFVEWGAAWRRSTAQLWEE